MFIQPVMRIAADVVALVDDKHVQAATGKLLGDHRSGKAGAHNQNVGLHCIAPASTAMSSATPADAWSAALNGAPHHADRRGPRRSLRALHAFVDQRGVGPSPRAIDRLEKFRVRSSHVHDGREVAHHVRHGGRDNRLARRHVLQRLGGVDIAGGVVQRERHQAHIETLDQVRQHVVRLLAQPMDVRHLRQLVLLHLYHRAGHHDRGVRKRPRQAGDERIVEPLVDDPEVAEHRTRQLRHRGGHLRLRKSGTAEVRHVHAATVKLHVVVMAALGFEQLVAAGENHVGIRQQKLLALGDISRSEAEVRQFVHAVVDDSVATEFPQQAGRRHRRIEPLHRILESASQQRVISAAQSASTPIPLCTDPRCRPSRQTEPARS